MRGFIRSLAVVTLLAATSACTLWHAKPDQTLAKAEPIATPTPVPTPPVKPVFYDVRDYGAKGDGASVDSPAVNKAIAAAAANGGGTIRFPPGNYICGSIHLMSNISLQMDQATSITASKNGADYDRAEPAPNAFQDFGHSHWHNSLIWGENLVNVSITGEGIIDASALPTNPAANNPLGNKTISLKLCRNVILRDFRMLRGGHFAILATGVDNLTIDNLKIDTNRDGIDVDCCKNVRISNLTVNSPIDDAICLKSTYALGQNIATDNVTITNCQVSGYEVGSLFDGTYRRMPIGVRRAPNGRIKFGTESNGGFRNITISNCVFDDCMGLALEMVDGGTLEDVTIDNITMRDVGYSAIFIRNGIRARGPDSPTSSTIRRVNISNIVAHNVDPRFSSIQIMGVPGHPVEEIKISNVRIDNLGGGTAQDAQRVPREDEKGYPEPNQYGGNIPTWGVYMRHVRDIQMDNIDLRLLKDDARPSFRLDDASGIDLMRIRADHGKGISTFRLTKVADFWLRNWGSKDPVHYERHEEGSF